MAYSPFGFLVSRKSENAPPPRADDPVLVGIANKYGKTANQVVLRYLVRLYFHIYSKAGVTYLCGYRVFLL